MAGIQSRAATTETGVCVHISVCGVVYETKHSDEGLKATFSANKPVYNLSLTRTKHKHQQCNDDCNNAPRLDEYIPNYIDKAVIYTSTKHIFCYSLAV